MRYITETGNYSPTELVVVAGHATFKDELVTAPDDPTDETSWVLQSFQKSEVRYYIDHMRAGAMTVATNTDSFGLFSGGRTRPGGGHWGEATTYEAVAAHYGFWQDPTDLEAVSAVQDRFGTEQFARDSFENVWFSLMEFYRRFGTLPTLCTVIGWPAKADRFKYHAEILGIPSEAFSYEGVEDLLDMDGFISGEITALTQWHVDPLGVTPPLITKRMERDPFHLGHPYGTFRDYVDVALEMGWQPSKVLLGAAALIGSTA